MTPGLAWEGLGGHAAAAAAADADAAAAAPVRRRLEEAPPIASPSGSGMVTSVSPGRSRRVNSKTNGRPPRVPRRDFVGCLPAR